MRSVILTTAATVAALAGLSGGAAARSVPNGAEVYYGFTLLDPADERRVENAYVVIQDGMIRKTGAGRPPKTSDPKRMHDLAGRFVLPGFIDAHAHITATGIQKVEVANGAVAISMESDDKITQHNARIALSRGVTTVRNPGGDPIANARYDRMVASGSWLGPEARHAGAVIEPPPFTGGMFAYPKTEAEWQAEAARQAGLGMTYFKLYTELTEAELATGIRAAHAHGLKAIAHLDGVSWLRAVEMGVDGLEHALPTSPDLLEPEQRAKYVRRPDSTFMYRWFELADYDGPLMRELVHQLAQKKVALNLTLIVNELVYNVDRQDQVYPASERVDFHPDVLGPAMSGLRRSATGWTPEDFARARAVMPKVLELARRLHDAGVPMMIGTDAGGGLFYARELALHRQAGIPTWDVLRMATSEAAQAMDLDDRIGRVRKGFEADLVILNADPLADIAAAGQVHGVITNGRFHTRAELTGRSAP